MNLIKSFIEHLSRRRWPIYLGLLLLLVNLCLIITVTAPWSAAKARPEELSVFSAEPTMYLEDRLPQFELKTVKPFSQIDEARSHSALTFDLLYYPVAARWPELHWYPLREIVAGIAVNRDLTDLQIDSYADLKQVDPSKETLCIKQVEPRVRLSYGALAKAYGGGREGWRETLLLLEKFADAGNFRQSKVEQSSIVLLFSDEFEEIQRAGGNFEFIIPKEGALQLAIGIQTPYELGSAIAEAYTPLAQEYRQDGESKLYKLGAEQYEEFLWPTQRLSHDLRKYVNKERLFQAKDHREHVMAATLAIFLIIAWVFMIVSQIYSRRMVLAFLFTAFCLVGWIMVRMLKYSTNSNSLNLLLWWLFYVFQLALTLCLLWTSLVIDRGKKPLPKPWYVILGFNLALMILALTNSYHQQMIHYVLEDGLYLNAHGYRWAFYLIWAVIFIESVAATVILALKNRQGVRRLRQFLVVMVAFMMVIYSVGYGINYKPFRQSDYTLVMCTFIVVYLWALFHSGLLPVHRGYRRLFVASNLRMQVCDLNGKSILRAKRARDLEAEIFKSLPGDRIGSVKLDPDTLLRTKRIPGGYFLWEEDLTELNEQEEKIAKRVRELHTANRLLSSQQAIQDELSSLKHRRKLLEELDAQSQDVLHLLYERLDQLAWLENKEPVLKEIAILLCYLKRHSNFFFYGEKADIAAEELTVYMDELIEIAELSGTKILFFNNLKGTLPVAQATCFYEILYSLIAFAEGQLPNSKFIVQLTDGPKLKMLLPRVEAVDYVLDEKIKKRLAKLGGDYRSWLLEEVVSVEFYFGEHCHD
ncbi:MAG: histidine kinase N-terminal 7TM domain-containing protein [Eubacteriales bacterium]|nr:histidine kinase N-terminal 7TM domain-containing protein [Eubacteriales bacterium]